MLEIAVRLRVKLVNFTFKNASNQQEFIWNIDQCVVYYQKCFFLNFIVVIC